MNNISKKLLKQIFLPIKIVFSSFFIFLTKKTKILSPDIGIFLPFLLIQIDIIDMIQIKKTFLIIQKLSKYPILLK